MTWSRPMRSRRGRPGAARRERKTAVHERAEALGIEVRTPRTLRDPEEQAQFRALDADLAVVAAYGLILPKPILEAPKAGCINVHASLLPRWRGAAPIQRAILAGDEISGVTIMRMDEGLDTGPMLLKRELDIRGKNAGQVTDETGETWRARRLIEWLDHPTAARAAAERRRDLCRARSTRPRRGSTGAQPAEAIERQVRAFNPVAGRLVRGQWRARSSCSRPKTAGFPLSRECRRGCWTMHCSIACGEGAIRPLLVQRAGRGADEHRASCCAASRFPKGTILP